ncbi:ABC transporter ATP-binding protein [Paracoccus cavernae]|uniref:ABC transporter ATP-binding protein n=1 Tax=Paracoccus cavernae TaxID=1571207 RepID=A0ABT8D6B9_9RHOB|nr:ABC transporter ATP-binding protein [Paracoccus cavernae]
MEVAQLSVSFAGNNVVEQMEFGLGRGEILGIVGESGSGKTVSCRALTGLLPSSATASGRLSFDGKTYDLSDPKALEDLRGGRISMIFQDPMSALDPLMRIRRQFALRGLDEAGAITALAEVGFADPSSILTRYPHQLSGGQCQRIMIACAMISQPRLLIADEPTTALDVTIQAGILALLRERARQTGMSILFITHDLGVVSEFCDRVLVMQRGKVEEIGRTADVLSAPRAAYTQSMIAAIPTEANRGSACRRLRTSRQDGPLPHYPPRRALSASTPLFCRCAIYRSII